MTDTDKTRSYKSLATSRFAAMDAAKTKMCYERILLEHRADETGFRMLSRIAEMNFAVRIACRDWPADRMLERDAGRLIAEIDGNDSYANLKGKM